MQRNRILPVLTLGMLTLGMLTGCMFGPVTPAARSRPVEVPFGHVHDLDCGHYWAENHWRHKHGHVHGPGCSHVFEGGRWASK